jgi:hypothetical protein
MKRTLAAFAVLLALAVTGNANAQQSPPSTSSQPSASQPSAQQKAAPLTPAPRGAWVYTSEYGWIWVPDGATTVDVDDVPYVYLYTPAYGWTWYVSPWGWGPYYVGDWVWHPWHPHVWHGWVAAPHVVVRLGPPAWRHHW